MFKNGTNPLNLNFKLPTPLGAPSLVNSTVNKKPNQSSSNLNSSLNSAKSNLSSVSTASSKSNASASFNSSANSIAKSLTLRSPSKSVATPAAADNKSAASNKSDLSNKSVQSTKSDRPTARPPPLPLKPPAINRRQSFDSGQLNVQKSLNHSAADASANAKPMGSNPIKPPPPPRFATMRPQATPTSDGSQAPTSTQTPGRQHKSTQNLLAAPGSTANTSSSSLSYSTMKIKANTKNYPSTQRPLGAPPPPPIPKAPASTTASSIAPSFLSNSNMQSSPLSYHSSSQLNSAPSIPKPPPPPPLAAHLPSAPLPPSLTSVTPMSALSSSGDDCSYNFYESIGNGSNNFYETIGSPSRATRTTSKGIYQRECFCVSALCA